MEAVVEVKGFQYTVKIGEKLKVPYLGRVVGKEMEFPLLMVRRGEEILIGKPYVKGSCKVEVVGEGREKKIIVYKYKSKKRYRRKYGHKQRYSEIKVKEIKVENGN